jgi:hypothetical protein
MSNRLTIDKVKDFLKNTRTEVEKMKWLEIKPKFINLSAFADIVIEESHYPLNGDEGDLVSPGCGLVFYHHSQPEMRNYDCAVAAGGNDLMQNKKVDVKVKRILYPSYQKVLNLIAGKEKKKEVLQKFL